jgi:hypothetical protein
MLAKMATKSGRIEEAITWAQKLRSLPEGTNWCHQLAETYARAGQREAALREAEACSDQISRPLPEHTCTWETTRRPWTSWTPDTPGTIRTRNYLNVDTPASTSFAANPATRPCSKS